MDWKLEEQMEMSKLITNDVDNIFTLLSFLHINAT